MPRHYSILSYPLYSFVIVRWLDTWGECKASWYSYCVYPQPYMRTP